MMIVHAGKGDLGGATVEVSVRGLLRTVVAG
jgi:hypothetical protein